MLKSDPLSFLDESSMEDPNPIIVDLSENSKKKDPLGFLNQSYDVKQSSSTNRNEENSNDSSDLLSFLDEPEEQSDSKFTPKPYRNEKTSPEKSLRQNVLDTYRPEEKTPEQLKAMSVQDRREYSKDLEKLRTLQSATGLAKGALSGFTFGASEQIPVLKPDEEDLMVGLGDVIGSYLPIAHLYNFIGKPIVNFAMKSPVAREGLMALGRMTGFGLSGVAYEGTKKTIKEKEIPSVEELAKIGGTWAAIDGVLQVMGLGVAFQQSVNRIAEAEGVTAKEVLERLWGATKNYVKVKFGRPIKGEILPEDIQVLMERAKLAETGGLKESEFEIAPQEEAIHFEEKISKPEIKLEKQIDADLIKAKNDLAELEKAQGRGATNERSVTIQKINELELEKHNQAKQKKPATELLEENKIEEKKQKPIYELSYDESEAELIKAHDFERKIIEPKVGSDAYQVYEKSGFEGQRKFWDKYADRFSEEEVNQLENYPYSPEELRARLNDIRDIRTSYNSGETPEESINNVISNIRKQLVLFNEPANKSLIMDAFKYLTDKGHTQEEIVQEIFNVLRRDFKEDDARYILESIFKSKPVKQDQIINLEKEVSEEEEAPSQTTFTTSKGSTYQVNENGSTIRSKAARPEHPGEEGIQPESEKTWYVSPEDSVKLGEIQAKGEDKKIVELPNGQLGVQYLTGKNAGKIEQRTLVDFSKEPVEGMIPVEAWGEGKKVHFGNQIIKIEKPIQKVAETIEPKESIPEELPKKQTQVPPRKTRPLQPVMGKKQAVARSKIIDLFRTAFNDPIRLGKISQKKAAGIHKPWPKVTRLLKDNDIETAAHEIGHNLHTTLYGGDAKTPQEQFKNIETALKPYLDELKPLAHYEPWGMEGFAEFTRLYVTNPDIAKELAPKFYDKFEADLEAQYPEMKNALLQAREYYDTYLQGTPQSRIRAQTSYGSDKGKLENIVESVKKWLNPDFLKTQFLDDVFPAKRLVAEAFGIPVTEVENLKDERNLYRALRVLKGAVGKGDVFVLHETFNAKTLDKINGSLRDILKNLPNEEAYREFNDYLIARRSIEKISQKVDTGINMGDAVTVEADLRPKYGRLAIELDAYNDSLLHYAKDSGLLSNEQYSMIKQNNLLYAPFQRVMEPEKGGAASGAGKLQAGKPIKQMKGSTRDIIAPIESIIKNTYSIILNAEKNLAGQVLAKIAKMKDVGAYVEAVPTPMKLKGKVEGEQVARELAKRFEKEGLSDLIEYDQNGKPVLREDIADAIPEVFLRFGAGQYPAGENIVTVFFDGKPKYYEVSPDIYEMWTKGIAPYTAGIITKILRIPARTLRAGAILNPMFIQKNVIRDTWGSMLFTKYGKSIKDPVGLFIDTVYSPLSMLATSAGKGKLYVEWMKSGGGMSTMQSLDRDSITKKLEEVRHGTKPHQVVKWLRQVAEISEETNRLSEFGKALEVEGKTRLGREIAAFAARDLSIDFAKSGLQTKVLNQIIPFWNATVQGGDKLVRTLFNPDDRKNFIPRVLGFIVIPSLMLAWLNKDDENIKEFQEQEKDFNFIVNVNGQYLKIPVPFETGVIAHGLTQRMFNYFMKKDPEAFEKFMGSVLDAMAPNFLPAFANPFMETWANKSFFTGARLIPPDKEALVSKYQYKNNTSSTARLLGRAMTYMLGQDTRSKAASPAIIDHFINSWTGGLGRMMINISDYSLESAGLSDKVQGPQEAITQKFGLDAFSTRFPRASTRSIEKFYDNYADATARKKSLKYAEKMELETDEELGAAYKRFDKIYDYNTLQKAYKSIQGCQKEINNIWNDPIIEPELKRQFIDDLYLQMIDFAKAANEDIKQYRLVQ